MKAKCLWVASLLFVVLAFIPALLGALAPSFSVTANPAAVQLPAGKTATSEISLSSDNGFSGSVQLACQDLPAAMSCNFTPSALQLDGATVVSSQLTISSSQQQASVFGSGQDFMVLSLITALVGMFFWRGPGAISKAVLHFLVSGLMLLSGCQGIATPAPKTYTIAVTASAAEGTSQSVQIDVTVP
jgi:hypothetical protein